MGNNKIEKICQYCGKEFNTVRADAKFCCKKHRLKAHRLAKTHLRLLAFSRVELEILKEIFMDYKYFLIRIDSITWKNRDFEDVVVFYIKESDFYKVYTLRYTSGPLCTPIGINGVYGCELTF